MELAELNAEEMRTEMNSLIRAIRILEWDKARQQINPAKLSKLEKMKKRYDELASVIKPVDTNEKL
jgi:hypothetical protein